MRDEVAGLLGIGELDRAEIDRMLGTLDPDAVAEATEAVRRRIGTFPARIAPIADDEFVVMAAYLATVEEALAFQAGAGVPAEVSRATFADFGRVLALNRRVHGRFGAEVHWWLGWHWAGSLYQLGRLQFALRQPGGPRPENPPVPGVGTGEWLLDVHIPDAGPLPPAAVDESLNEARSFFAEYFGDKPARTAICASWLLDPYLAEQLPTDSNIARFARRFTPYGDLRDAPGDALYFTFRTRDTEHLDRLPRQTALQRLVLDRIAAGGTWQVGYGYLRL